MDGSRVGSFRKTQENLNNESFQTSTANTHTNLYITTKRVVPLHQGICYCHTVQVPSFYNCCISMHFCKTTRILRWVFFSSTVSHKEIKTYIHTTFCMVFFARGLTEYISILLAKCISGCLRYGGCCGGVVGA